MNRSKYQFGSVSGSVTINEAGGNIEQAGGDVVHGNKIISSLTVSNGFQHDADKEKFLAELENLRTLLRSVKTEVEVTDAQNEDKRDALSKELLDQIMALKELREQTAQLAAGQAAAPEQTRSVTDCLVATNQLMDKAQTFGEKAAELSLKIAPVIITLKSLFGM